MKSSKKFKRYLKSRNSIKDNLVQWRNLMKYQQEMGRIKKFEFTKNYKNIRHMLNLQIKLNIKINKNHQERKLKINIEKQRLLSHILI